MWSDDPIRDAEDYSRECEAEYHEHLRGCPECAHCGHKVDTNEAHTHDTINDLYFHPDCYPAYVMENNDYRETLLQEYLCDEIEHKGGRR